MNKYSKTKVLSTICRITVNTLFALLLFFFILILVYSARFYYLYSNENIKNPKFTDGNLDVYMLDVGQGESFLFLQNDKAMLVDAGTMYDLELVRNYLKDVGVKKLDYLVITHPHQDHEAGIVSVMAHVKVDKIITAEIPKKEWSFSESAFIYAQDIFLKYVDFLTNNKLVSTYKEFSEDNTFADSSFYFLDHVSEDFTTVNDYSLVMKVTYKNVKILLTGDIQISREKKLIESGEDLSADIYVAAHHGSKTSNSKSFLEKVNPSYVLISSCNGNDNLYGHPVKDFVRYLEQNQIPVYRTDESGTVIIKIDGEKIEFDSNQDDYKSGKELIFDRKNEK